MLHFCDDFLRFLLNFGWFWKGFGKDFGRGLGSFWEGFERDLIGFWAVAAELLAVACFYLLLLTFACFGLLWLALACFACFGCAFRQAVA